MDEPHAPQTCASTSSATSASTVNIIHTKSPFVKGFSQKKFIFFKEVKNGRKRTKKAEEFLILRLVFLGMGFIKHSENAGDIAADAFLLVGIE